MEINENMQYSTVYCEICGENHLTEKCTFIKIIRHVPDNAIPSKAKLTLPDFLKIEILSDNSYGVSTKELIEKGTKFGPFLANKIQTICPTIPFPLKIFSDNEEHYLDTSDENECSWLIFVGFADSFEEQNLICYQANQCIYYVAIKNIEPDQVLKVWYSPYYAQKMNLSVLTAKSFEEVDENIDVYTLVKNQQKIIDRKVWTCKFCGQNEDNVVVFAKHLLKHYSAQLKKKCEICKSTFQTAKSLKFHLKIVHYHQFSTPKKQKSNSVMDKINNKDAVGGPLLNDIFTDSLDNSINLNQFDINNIDNQNLLDADYDNLLNENVKKLDQFDFEIDDSQKQYVCDVCLKQFTKIQLLIAHLRLHTGDFMCYKCLKIFCRRENLKNHFCNLVEKFTCEICHKKFTQRKYLSRHSKVHEGKLKCPNCHRAYFSNKELQEHNCSKIDNYLKEKFVCSLCDKIFYRLSYLKKHMKTHGPKSGDVKKAETICEICGVHLENKNSCYSHRKIHQEKRFRCGICDKLFHRKDGLGAHLKTHQNQENEYECEICHKKLKTRKILVMHLNSHKGISHKCGLCDASFKYRTSLNKHTLKYHRSKKQSIKHINTARITDYFNCPVCNKSIKLRSSLLRHLRKIHPDVPINLSQIKPKLFKLPATTQIPENRSVEKKSEISLSGSHENIVNDQMREVCLSIPDLNEADQEITLDQNAYILENGTIVQPQEDSDKVIIYVLDQDLSVSYHQ